MDAFIKSTDKRFIERIQFLSNLRIHENNFDTKSKLFLHVSN